MALHNLLQLSILNLLLTVPQISPNLTKPTTMYYILQHTNKPHLQISTNTENCCRVLGFAARYGFQGAVLQDSAACALRVAAANFALVTQSGIVYCEVILLSDS